jgi:hypothetical protein
MEDPDLGRKLPCGLAVLSKWPSEFHTLIECRELVAKIVPQRWAAKEVILLLTLSCPSKSLTLDTAPALMSNTFSLPFA